MEATGSSKLIGQLSLPIAVAYFTASALLTPSIEGVVVPVALEALMPLTAPLYGVQDGAWAANAARFLAFSILAVLNLLLLAPILLARGPRLARVALALVASVSVAAASYLVANMPAWLACNALAALVVGGVALHRFQPNNSSKRTPLRGAA